MLFSDFFHYPCTYYGKYPCKIQYTNWKTFFQQVINNLHSWLIHKPYPVGREKSGEKTKERISVKKFSHHTHVDPVIDLYNIDTKGFGFLNVPFLVIKEDDFAGGRLHLSKNL